MPSNASRPKAPPVAWVQWGLRMKLYIVIVCFRCLSDSSSLPLFLDFRLTRNEPHDMINIVLMRRPSKVPRRERFVSDRAVGLLGEGVSFAFAMFFCVWGISTVGSALHSHCRGQRFESAMLHQVETLILKGFLFFLYKYCKSKKTILTAQMTATSFSRPY